MIEKIGKFNYEVYRELLKYLETKYNIITASEAIKAKPPYLILRHDIDGSIEAALTMAEIEKEMGIRASYFVLFSHKLYNPLERDSLHLLRKILELDHEIGLHYDLEAYDDYGSNPMFSLKKEAELLEYALNKQIRCIAKHQSFARQSNHDLLYSSDYINCTNGKWYDLHISDGYRRWGKEWADKLFSFEYDRVQLTIHPFLWTETEVDGETCLKRLFEKTGEDNKNYYLKWLNFWNARRP